jgi:ATP-dependent RNA helicase DDX41
MPTHYSADAKKTVEEKAEEADAELLEAIKSRRKLASDMELAKGIKYTESLKTRYVRNGSGLHLLLIFSCSWRPPRFIRERTEDQHSKLRDKYHIIVEGDDIPPPIESFRVCPPPSSVLCQCSQLR